MLEAIPFVAILVIFGASIVRGEAIRRQGGDRVWAFADSRGKQRVAGLAFALSILVSHGAGLQALLAGARGYPIGGALIAIAGALIVIAAQSRWAEHGASAFELAMPRCSSSTGCFGSAAT